MALYIYHYCIIIIFFFAFVFLHWKFYNHIQVTEIPVYVHNFLTTAHSQPELPSPNRGSRIKANPLYRCASEFMVLPTWKCFFLLLLSWLGQQWDKGSPTHSGKNIISRCQILYSLVDDQSTWWKEGCKRGKLRMEGQSRLTCLQYSIPWRQNVARYII